MNKEKYYKFIADNLEQRPFNVNGEADARHNFIHRIEVFKLIEIMVADLKPKVRQLEWEVYQQAERSGEAGETHVARRQHSDCYHVACIEGSFVAFHDGEEIGHDKNPATTKDICQEHFENLILSGLE